MYSIFYILSCIFHISIYFQTTKAVGEIIWAVNCGGEEHIDIHGVRYQRDNLNVGIISDYGKNMVIHRIPPEDQTLYQTERYNTADFGYEIPIPNDGDYTIVLKFSEVWFTAPDQKVFDVILNAEHTIVRRLDIFAKVGRGCAHDEMIAFKVKGDKLYFKGESSDLYYNKISVDFIKGDRDNPKINAIYLMKGRVEDAPKLPSFVPDHRFPSDHSDHSDSSIDHNEKRTVVDIDEEDSFPSSLDTDDTDITDTSGHKHHHHNNNNNNGPRSPDPYSTEDTSSMFLPIAVAVGAFLPILFCLCKL